MSIRDILFWPDARLSKPCDPVEAITDNIRALADDMLETMYDAPGRGLAAPQIGEMIRLFVTDTTWKDGTRAPMVFVNPLIVSQSNEQQTMTEGCLSIPGVTTEVTRPAEVTLDWLDLEGQRQTGRFDGFAAACVQHELDHLDGVVTLDHLADDVRADVLQAYQGKVRA